MRNVLLALLLLATTARAATLHLQPRAIDRLFANPGMGWQTFHRFADEDKALAGLPSGSAYFRFYWREVETQPGQIDFALFDRLFAHAEQAGQKLAFRIMCTGSGQYIDVPQWLKVQGCKGTEFKYEGQNHWVPDFADPKFQEAHFRLIRELGRRYDGHPAMDLLDIGSVGLWAEWHMSGTEALDTGKEVPLPPLELRLAIIEAWVKAFPKSRKVVLIGSEEAMALTTPRQLGWRADCLGDMGGFSKTWNHMDHFYRQQLRKTGAGEAWKNAPVAFESCWEMGKWVQSGWDVRYIFDYALDCHASYINNKSAPLPEGTREEVERLLRQLGYRLVLRDLHMPSPLESGHGFTVETEWENVGVAPPYVDHLIALQLRSPGPGGKTLVLPSKSTIQGWLPGPHRQTTHLQVPVELAPGTYQASLGLIDPATRRAEIQLAIDLPATNNWYSIGTVEIR